MPLPYLKTFIAIDETSQCRSCKSQTSGNNLCGRPLDGSPVPCVWLDATYVKCRREGRVASTAVVTAIGCVLMPI